MTIFLVAGVVPAAASVDEPVGDFADLVALHEYAEAMGLDIEDLLEAGPLVTVSDVDRTKEKRIRKAAGYLTEMHGDDADGDDAASAESEGAKTDLLTDALDYDEASWKKVMGAPTAAPVLQAATKALANLDKWDEGSIETALRSMLAEQELSASKGLQPLRVAVSGSSVSPPLFESMAVLGRDRTLNHSWQNRHKPHHERSISKPVKPGQMRC